MFISKTTTVVLNSHIGDGPLNRRHDDDMAQFNGDNFIQKPTDIVGIAMRIS